MDIHDEQKTKRLFYFAIAVLSAVILFWFGAQFLFFPDADLNSGVLAISGVGLILGGLFMVGPTQAGTWQSIVIVVSLGIYLCARALGIIEMTWFANIVGIASWATALYLVYSTWPARHEDKD